MPPFLAFPVFHQQGFYAQKELTTETQKWTLRVLQEYENRNYLCTFPFSQENHYLGSKNIILFTLKLACEWVFRSVACGNRHLCSIFFCHFRVYFQEN